MANEFKIKHGFTSTGSGTIDGTLNVSTGINVNGAAVATQSWVSGQGFATSGSVSGNYLALSGGTLTGDIKILYNDHASGAGYDTQLYIGKSDTLGLQGAFPTYVPAGSYGFFSHASSDGVFFGSVPVSAGASNYYATIAWGDDATEYLQFLYKGGQKAYLTTDGHFHIDGNFYASGGNSTQWNTAYGWGDHASAGYLTSFDITTQTDSKYLRSDQNDVMNGFLTINSTSDAQIQLTSSDTWTGIGFNDGDANGADYIWHRGSTQTFAIGGGGSSVAGKKLHIHGGTTIGSGIAGTTVPTNSLLVEQDVIVNGGRLKLYNANHGSWDDGLMIDSESGWAATIYRRGDAPKMFTGLRSGTDNYIWMSPIYSNAGTTISAPRADAVLEARADNDTLEIYLPTNFGQDITAPNLAISNWNTAYSWGNHASAGYLTSYTETDTLASVTARGSVTTAAVQVNKLQLDSADNYIDTISSYLHLASKGNEIIIGGSTAMYVNYRASTEGTPTDWYWKAGSSSSWSNHSFGNISANGTISATGVITATGGNSTNWNTAYNWGDHSAAGYATASHNHDSRYYTESEIDTKLAAKADTSHKYHRFNNGDEYYDSYGQDNYLRMFTETATFDTFRFRSYSNVEYWNGSAWEAWGANLDTWFDGREDTGFNLDRAHSHFRFEINRSSGWPTMALFVIQSSWSDTNSHTCEVILETWDGASWVIKDQWVYSNFQRGINLHATNQTHDGISSMRVTLNIDWVDASHSTYPLRRILFLSNFSGGETLDPWTWNYNKVVNFDALPQAAGANLATQSWVTSQGYVSSLSGYATESYVNTAVSNLVAAAPATLDTLNELAAAIGDDANFSTTVTNSIATKLPLAGGTLTGDLYMADGTSIRFNGSTNSTRLYSNDWGVKFENNNGYIHFGPANDNWTHIYSDKNFYFNQNLYVAGNRLATESYVTSRGYLTSVPSEYLTQAEGDARYYTESEVNGLIEAHTGWQTGSDFVNGTLVRTSIDASQQNGDSFVLRVVGKSYSTTHSPFDMILQGYIYNNTFINYSAIVNSTDALGNIRILELDGQLCFWWARFGYWNSFEIYVTSVSGGDTTPQNRVIAVEDVAEPDSTLGKKVTVTPYESWTTKEFSQSSVNNWNTAYGWGNHASAGYAASSHNHDGVYLPIAGKAADSEKVDGINGASLLRSDAADNFSGTLTWNGAGGATALSLANANIVGVNQIEINDPGEGIIWKGGANGDITLATVDDAADNILNVSGTGASFAVNGSKVATESWVASQGYITSSGANYYVDGLSFDTGTGVLTASVNGTTNQTVDLDGRYALSSHSHSYLPLSGGTITGNVIMSNTNPMISFVPSGTNDAAGIRFNYTNNDGVFEFWTSDDYNEPFVWRAYDVGLNGAGTYQEWMKLVSNSLYVGGSKMATETFVTSQGYLTSVTAHTHNAADITSGTLSSARLSGTYSISISGSSASSNRLNRDDNRTIAPSEDSNGSMSFGFTSWTNDNTGGWADYLHLRSYTDSSGGNDNLVMFSKDSIEMRIWQQSYGSSTPYANFRDVAFKDELQTPAITSNGSTPSLNSGITASEIRSLIGAGTSSSDTNYYLSGASFNTSDGVLTLTVSGAANQAVDLDGRYQLAGTYNTIIGTDSDINTSGATIIDNIYVTDGVITSMGTRTLTQADLGITTNVSGNWWNGGYAAVGTDGVMEVGKYIDFHDTDTQTSDFSYRITNTGDRLYFGGDIEIDGGDIFIADGNTRLHEGGGNALRVTTNSGFIEMGPMNTSHCHIQTDRSNFYFNTEIRVDTGIIGSYNEDLQLRRSNTTKITVGSSLTTFANHISVPQPDAPIFSAANIVGETIEVVFDQSPTSGVDYYQVWSSVAGGAYGMIAQIPTQDIAATMTAIDADFSRSGTHAYRIYAVKNGVYSNPAEGSVNFTTPTLDVLNMSVVNLNSAYYIQYEMPDSRFVDHIEIYMDAEASSGSLSRTGATLIYSGNNTSYMYQIGASDLNKFHQFWVEVVES